MDESDLVAFHGTSSAFLEGIMEQGMLPKPSTKAWEVDPGASVYTQSRISLPGSYWTMNLMTAISSAGHTSRKFGGERLIVMMGLNDPDAPSIVPDEDTIRYEIQRLVSKYLGEQGLFFLHLEYYTDVVGYIDALEGYAELTGDEPLDWIAGGALYLLEQLFNNFASFASAQFSVNPELATNEHKELWIELLRAHAIRRSSYNWTEARMQHHAFGDPTWRTEGYDDYRRSYNQGVKQATWQLRQLVDISIKNPAREESWEVWEQKDKEREVLKVALDTVEREFESEVYNLKLQPESSSEAEANYLDILDRVSRAYPHWAHKEITSAEAGIRSFRILDTVGFHGTNQIIGIVGLPKNKFGHVDLVYGEKDIPEAFVNEYIRTMATSFTLYEDGEPLAHYGG